MRSNSIAHLHCFLNGGSSERLSPKVVVDSSSSTLNLESLKSRKVFVADGGLKYVPQNFINTYASHIYWFGDNDSVDQKLLDKISSGNKIFFQKDKDFSDFASVLDKIEQDFSLSTDHVLFLEVFFGLGKQRAHELVNICEAMSFCQRMQTPCCVLFHPHVVVTTVNISIEMGVDKEFSIASLSYPNRVEIKGAKYSGTLELSRPSHGLSNVSTKDTVEIGAESSSSPIIVIF